MEGDHAAIYDTRHYNRFRRLLGRVIAGKWLVAGAVVGAFVLAILGMGVVKKQQPVIERLPSGYRIERATTPEASEEGQKP